MLRQRSRWTKGHMQVWVCVCVGVGVCVGGEGVEGLWGLKGRWRLTVFF